MKRGNIYAIGTFGREITQASILSQLAMIGEVDEIVVHVNSGGGGVPDGWACFATLSEVKARKVAIVEGICASIATVFALACDEIHIARGGSWMVHEPRWTEGGTADQMEQNAEFLRAKCAEMVALYAAKTKLDSDSIRALLKKEKYLSAAEALSFGFVDSISDQGAALDSRAVASVDPEKLPAALRALLKGQAMDPEELKKENEALKAQVAALVAECEELKKGNSEAKAKAEEEEKKAAEAKAKAEAEEEEKKGQDPSVTAQVKTLVDAMLERDKLISGRPDLTPAMVAQLKEQPVGVVKAILEALPRTTNPVSGAIAAAAQTSGAVGTQGGTPKGELSALSPAPVVAALDHAFGLAKAKPAVQHENNISVFSAVGTLSAGTSKK